jgi:hypothetical protein
MKGFSSHEKIKKDIEGEYSFSDEFVPNAFTFG